MKKNNKKVMIKLPLSKKDKYPLYACVNGMHYIIHRNIWVSAPLDVVEAIKQSKHIVDEGGAPDTLARTCFMALSLKERKEFAKWMKNLSLSAKGIKG